MALEYLVFVAAAISLLAAAVYIRSMFRGGAKPNRISWFMWTIAPFIATAAAVSSGVGWAVLPVFMSGFGPFLIFVASFFTKGTWKISSFDYACGVLSALAIILWLVTRDPNLAITLAIASDALAAVPTLTKSWSYPESESPWPFVVGSFAPATSFAAATMWTFSEYAFPAYLIAINALALAAIYKKGIVGLLKK